MNFSRSVSAGSARLLGLLAFSQLFVTNGACQTFNFWNEKPKYTLDLQQHGYQHKAGWSASAGGTLAFVSNSVIVGTIAQAAKSWSAPPRNVYAFDTNRNTVRDVSEIPVFPSQFCPISDRRIAIAGGIGVVACDEQLNCKVVLRQTEMLTASPFGTRLAVHRPFGTREFVADTSTWKTITAISPMGRNVKIIPGDEHMLIQRGSGPEVELDERQTLRLTGAGTPADVEFLDSYSFAAIEFIPSAVVVFNLSGAEKYRISTDPVGSVYLLRAPLARRFAVVEVGYTFWNKVVNFLDIVNGRPRDRLKVRVFETAGGKEVARFE